MNKLLLLLFLLPQFLIGQVDSIDNVSERMVIVAKKLGKVDSAVYDIGRLMKISFFDVEKKVIHGRLMQISDESISLLTKRKGVIKQIKINLNSISKMRFYNSTLAQTLGVMTGITGVYAGTIITFGEGVPNFANSSWRPEYIFAGVSLGTLSAIIGRKLLGSKKLNRNKGWSYRCVKIQEI